MVIFHPFSLLFVFFAMYRFFATAFFREIWNRPLTSPVVKRHVLRLLPFSDSCTSSNYRVASARHLTSGGSLRKDTTQPKTEPSEEKKKIDLDVWKSMMRSQGTDGNQGHNGEEPGGEDATPEGPVTDKDILEATRELVMMWRHAGRTVPEQISDDDAMTLAQLPTKSSKKKYLKYLAIKERYKKAHQEKQLKRRVEKEALLEKKRENMNDGETGQGLSNSLFLQFWDSSLDKLVAWRSAQAMIFGQPLVFDMNYEKNMSRRELQNAVNQFLEVEGVNRRSSDPFHLHLCNLQPDGAYKHELVKRYSAETWDRLMITATDRQHVDVFPHERLVYLTADSPNVLRTFDHSKIYIIGALVDRSIQSGLSLANAKRLKLATARLPLDNFLHWGCGAKNLTLDQMIRILLTVKDTGNWEKALQFVPKRKHGGLCQQQSGGKISNYRAREDRAIHQWKDKDGERTLTGYKTGNGTFRSGVNSFSNSFKDHKFINVDKKGKRDRTAVSKMAGQTCDRENKLYVTRLRTSFKSKMENMKITGKNNKT
ncbi:tRNA methyltransferase 10 homolog C [Lampris incognitus]|uniref:tRNA methyltransferase 10 homolog C n=1 Tax=Lampris incognitus TaxID=2546036 RepID=UPI0024B623B5|nr:tRNA methyltransferase 10 homolog C [Lampris incognitus]